MNLVITVLVGLQKLLRGDMETTVFHVYKKDAFLNADKVVGVMLDADKINQKLENGEISLETHEIEKLTLDRLEGSY